MADLKEAQAALDAALQWRDISTAPRDGTPIDVWSPNEGRRIPDVEFIREFFRYRNVDQINGVEWIPVCNPTHWLPLPPAPDE